LAKSSQTCLVKERQQALTMVRGGGKKNILFKEGKRKNEKILF